MATNNNPYCEQPLYSKHLCEQMYKINTLEEGHWHQSGTQSGFSGELFAVREDRRYCTFGTVAPVVRVFDGAGTLLHEWSVPITILNEYEGYAIQTVLSKPNLNCGGYQHCTVDEDGYVYFAMVAVLTDGINQKLVFWLEQVRENGMAYACIAIEEYDFKQLIVVAYMSPSKITFHDGQLIRVMPKFTYIPAGEISGVTIPERVCFWSTSNMFLGEWETDLEGQRAVQHVRANDTAIYASVLVTQNDEGVITYLPEFIAWNWAGNLLWRKGDADFTFALDMYSYLQWNYLPAIGVGATFLLIPGQDDTSEWHYYELELDGEEVAETNIPANHSDLRRIAVLGNDVYLQMFSASTINKYSRYPLTEWWAYFDITKTSLGTYPTNNALYNESANLCLNLILDLRTAIEGLVDLQAFHNPDTGNLYHRNPSGELSDNIFYAAMGPRENYGATGGILKTWTHSSAASLENSPMYDIDIGEIYECVRVLEGAEL